MAVDGTPSDSLFVYFKYNDQYIGHLRVESYFLEGHYFASGFVFCFVHCTVGSLADFLHLLVSIFDRD